MSINGTLRSGLTWSMESEFDLHVFNEIFVNLEYREAFVDKVCIPASIVDLGANVGYFSLYAADWCLRAGVTSFHITAIDASGTNVETMIRRFRAQPTDKLVGKITVKQALVGILSGQAPFAENQNHAVNGIYPGGVMMPYTPVAELIPEGRIDILKVDIEGCEQMLLESQPDLFRRASTTILEFHHDRVDVDQCEKMLFAMGFEAGYTCREAGLVSVRVYYK